MKLKLLIVLGIIDLYYYIFIYYLLLHQNV